MMIDHDDFRMELCRRITRKAADKLAEHGAETADVAVGMALGLFDVIELQLGGDGHAAVEWLRTAADVVERQLLARDGAPA